MTEPNINPSEDAQEARADNATGPLGIRFFNTASPFKGLSESEMVELMRMVGEEAGGEYDEVINELQESILSTDPIMMLASFSYYGLIGWEEHDPELDRENPILQHHVELLQAFSLRNAYDKYEMWLPAHFEMLHDLIRRADTSFTVRRFADLKPSMSINERRRMAVLEHMRMDTQAIRNWGYPGQIVRTVTGLFASFDDDIQQTIGIRIEDLVQMCQNIIALAEERGNLHLNRIRMTLVAGSVEEMFQNYYEAFPNLQGTPKEALKAFEERGGITTEEARFALIQHSDLRLPDIFTFTMDDFVNAYPAEVAKNALTQVINDWSLQFGSLADINKEHFFMGNPIWQRPLIKLGHNEFYCPIVGLLHSFSLELMESLIETYPNLKQRYERSRAQFLEDEVGKLISKAFPSADVWRGSVWIDPETGEEYENDLLAVIDSVMLIVEAKSGRVSASARRGAELRLERTIEDLQIAPSEQSDRFAEYLLGSKGIVPLTTRQGVTNDIDTSQIQIVARLNCILEDVGILSYGWPSLKAAGFIPSDLDLVPTISLMDLETVFEVLEREGQILHYLLRRSEFEKNADYIGDEMDLLAFYIDTRFVIGDAEFGDQALMLYGISATLRPYLMPETRGRQPLPSPKYTDWWSTLLTYVERQRIPRWTLVSILLRSLPLETQVELEQIIQQKQADLADRIASTENDEAYFSWIGTERKCKGVVVFAYKNMPSYVRNQWMQNLVNTATGEFNMQEGVVIGLEAEQDLFGPYPYGVLGYFSMPSD